MKARLKVYLDKKKYFLIYGSVYFIQQKLKLNSITVVFSIYGATTFSIETLNIPTLNISPLSTTIKVLNWHFMFNSTPKVCFDECLNAGCYYAGCYYAFFNYCGFHNVACHYAE